MRRSIKSNQYTIFERNSKMRWEYNMKFACTIKFVYKLSALSLLIATSGCYSITTAEQRKAQRIRQNPVYSQKLAEKATTEGRIKYFLAQGDTAAAQEEMKLLKLHSAEIKEAAENADIGETPEWIYNNEKRNLKN